MNLFLADQGSQSTNVPNKCSALADGLLIASALTQVLFPVGNGLVFSQIQTLPDISTNSNCTFFMKSSLVPPVSIRFNTCLSTSF